mmetsp:Transcript_20804/g.33831  ORF Transcript_20804/g.33831 Transcript_20804/m.33831 type:complete len:283 (-) Transcript_20804:155-1003(-)
MRSIPQSTSIRTTIRPRAQHARSSIPRYYLRPSKHLAFVPGGNAGFRFVSQSQHFGNRRGVETVLEEYGAVLRAIGDAESGCVDGGLRIHPIRQHIHHQLQMTLRLHEPSHITQRRVQLIRIGVRHQRRNDGVIGTLGRREGVRMCRIKGEPRSSILEGEAAVFGGEAGAKAHEVAINKAHGIPIAVHHLKAHRTTSRSGFPVNHRLITIEQFQSSFRNALLVQQPFRRCLVFFAIQLWLLFRKVGVADVGTRISESQSHHFDLRMQHFARRLRMRGIVADE